MRPPLPCWAIRSLGGLGGVVAGVGTGLGVAGQLISLGILGVDVGAPIGLALGVVGAAAGGPVSGMLAEAALGCYEKGGRDDD